MSDGKSLIFWIYELNLTLNCTVWFGFILNDSITLKWNPLDAIETLFILLLAQMNENANAKFVREFKKKISWLRAPFYSSYGHVWSSVLFFFLIPDSKWQDVNDSFDRRYRFCIRTHSVNGNHRFFNMTHNFIHFFLLKIINVMRIFDVWLTLSNSKHEHIVFVRSFAIPNNFGIHLWCLISYLRNETYKHTHVRVHRKYMSFLYFHFLLAHLVSFFVSQTHIYKITRCGERYILACEWIYTNLDVHFFLACIVYSIWLFILIEYKFIIPFMFIFVGTIYSIYQIYLIVRASMLWSFAFQKYFIY